MKFKEKIIGYSVPGFADDAYASNLVNTILFSYAIIDVKFIDD